MPRPPVEYAVLSGREDIPEVIHEWVSAPASAPPSTGRLLRGAETSTALGSKNGGVREGNRVRAGPKLKQIEKFQEYMAERGEDTAKSYRTHEISKA